jgi:hypothetical protein
MRRREHAQHRLVVKTMLAPAALQVKPACELGRPAMRVAHGCYAIGGNGFFAAFVGVWLRKHLMGHA